MKGNIGVHLNVAEDMKRTILPCSALSSIPSFPLSFFFRLMESIYHNEAWAFFYTHTHTYTQNSSLVVQHSVNSMHVEPHHFLCVMSATAWFPSVSATLCVISIELQGKFIYRGASVCVNLQVTHTQYAQGPSITILCAFYWLYGDKLDDVVHCLPCRQQLPLTWLTWSNNTRI